MTGFQIDILKIMLKSQLQIEVAALNAMKELNANTPSGYDIKAVIKQQNLEDSIVVTETKLTEIRRQISVLENPGRLSKVVFKTAPADLKEIITIGKQYPISSFKEGETRIVLDNEYGHWIKNEHLVFI